MCKRSTSLEVYHRQVNTSSSRMAHITIFGVLWWAPTDCEWPKLWKVFHLGENPSLQVCCQTRGSESHTFVSGELAGWSEKTHSWQDADMRTSRSPNCARILRVLYIVEPLHALPHKKLKPSTSEDMHLLQETLKFRSLRH